MNSGQGRAPTIGRTLRRLLKVNRSALRLASTALALLCIYLAFFRTESDESEWIIVTPPPGKTTVVEVHVEENRKDVADRIREAQEQELLNAREARLSAEGVRVRAELEKAPTLLWDRTFDEWNRAEGRVPMSLKWDQSPGSTVGFPNVLKTDKVYFFNIKAPGVFSAMLQGKRTIIPIYGRPNEEEAERVYLAGAPDPVSWQRDADSDMGGYVANRWGGKLSQTRPPNADPEQASGQRYYSPASVNRGKGPQDAPYSKTSEVPQDAGFGAEIQEPPTDEVRHWEFAFAVSANDTGDDYELIVRNVEPLSTITEPWICSIGISYQDDEIPQYVGKSDFLRDMR
jgi:hypothetical protein